MVFRNFRLLLLIAGGLFVVICFSAHTRANGQRDTASWNRHRTKATPTPTKKPTPRQRIVRNVPPPAPPLSVQMRIIKVNQDNSGVDVSQTNRFHNGDRLRIAMKSDQDV